MYSCRSEVSQDSIIFQQKIELNKIDSVFFDLDTMSTSRNNSSQVISFNGESYFSFLNKKNNSIYFYSLNSGKLVKKFTFPLNGIDGVGKISHYFLSSFDSVFLYSYGAAKLSLVDSTGEVISNYNIEGDYQAVRPEVNSSRPIFKVKSLLGFNSWGSEKEYYNNDKFPEKSFMFLDVHQGEKKYFISYPDVYKGAIWGVQFYQFYHDVNYKDNKLILSFPIENDLTIFDLESYKTYKVNSNLKKNLQVKPLSYRKGKIVPELTEEVKHQMRQDYYSLIKYDSVNSIYARVVNKRFDENYISSFSGLYSIFGDYSIIFLNSEFQFIGQIDDLKNRYYITSMFFLNGKLYLEQLQNYNEDILVFDIFDINFLSEKK